VFDVQAWSVEHAIRSCIDHSATACLETAPYHGKQIEVPGVGRA